MGASYSADLSETKDWVRLLIGDRDVSRPFLQDEEIEALLVETGDNKYCAAAMAAEAIVARGHGLVEKAVDDLRLRWSDNKASAYHEYIKSLRSRCAAAAPHGKNYVFRVIGP